MRRVQRLADVRAELSGGIERSGAPLAANATPNPADPPPPLTLPPLSPTLHHSRRARRARRRGAPRPGHRRRRRGQRRADQGLARRRRVLLRRRAGGQDPRPRAAHHADPRVAVRQQDPPGGAAALRRPRPAAAVPAGGEPAGVLPVHGRGVPVQARGRGPGPDVRRGGRPVPHQPPVQAGVGGTARHPAVDRVRLRHPVRPRPGGEPRRLRQGRRPPASRSPRWTT